MPRSSVWVIGVTALRHHLQAGDDNEFAGKAGQVSIGGGYVSRYWFSTLSLDIVLGPYEPNSATTLDVDWSGTGASWWVAYSAQNLDVRSPEGSYGFALGFNYADMVGRSIGRNRREPRDPTDQQSVGLIDNYQMRINSFAVMPAIYFSWFEAARPLGNKPELLATRLEGTTLAIGVSAPVASSWSARYDRRIAAATETTPPIREQVRERGKLHGYSVFASVHAMLGI